MNITQNSPKHFIDLSDFNLQTLRLILDNARNMKNQIKNSDNFREEQVKILPHKILAMIFEKSSTRTRISFESAITHLGGSAIVMNKSDTQLGKGETIEDSAKVMSRMVDAVMIRCYQHQTLLDFAKSATIPVINGLSNFSHPCQIMASIMAIEERLGNISNLTLAWFGDANNVLNSYIQGAVIFGYNLRIAKPNKYNFCDEEISLAISKGAKIIVSDNPNEMAKNADILITDTWFSMGDGSDENEISKQEKLALLMPYQINQNLMKLANQGAIFTHCLPLYRNYEATAEVADSNSSIIFEEAENRLHIQKAILQYCLGKS